MSFVINIYEYFLNNLGIEIEVPVRNTDYENANDYFKKKCKKTMI